MRTYYLWKIKGRIRHSRGIQDNYFGDISSGSSEIPSIAEQKQAILRNFGSDTDYFGADAYVEEIYSCTFLGSSSN